MGEKHTPGPWEYRSQPHDDWGIVRAGRYIICQARDPRVDDDNLDDYRRAKVDPWEANARLIAAAPDLLAALEALLADCGDAGSDGYVENSIHIDEVRAARAAIAKATPTDTKPAGEGEAS